MTFVPTNKQRRLVRELVTAGMPICQVVPQIINRSSGRPVSPTTFRRAFRDDLAAGNALLQASIVNAIVTAAVAGSARAQALYIKHFMSRPEPSPEPGEQRQDADGDARMREIKRLLAEVTRRRDEGSSSPR